MKFKQLTRLISALGLLALASPAVAREGGWVSSGGNLLDDAANPWWLRNTTEVKYCLAVDAASVSNPDPIGVLGAAVGNGLQYWQTEFRFQDGSPATALGTQRFTKVDCSAPDVDLRIQLGEGTLDVEQRAYLGDRLSRIVGIAVRTHYDEINLRGRGFIYITGDATDSLRPWSKAQRVAHVVAHELGHVFGMPHIPETIMDEDGPSYWMKDEEFHDRHHPLPFAWQARQFETCGLPGVDLRHYYAFFETDKPCFRIEIAPDVTRGRVLTRSNHDEPWSEIGTIRANGSQAEGRPIVRIYLNPRQTVFPTTAPFLHANFALWQTRFDELLFTSASGQVRPMQVQVTPTSVTIRGLLPVDGVPVITTVHTMSRRYGDWAGQY